MGLLFFYFTKPAFSQKPTILLTGTIHYIPDSISNNWSEFRQTLERFKPDAICVEYRIPTDTVSLMQTGGKRYFLILDSLKRAWGI